MISSRRPCASPATAAYSCPLHFGLHERAWVDAELVQVSFVGLAQGAVHAEPQGVAARLQGAGLTCSPSSGRLSLRGIT